MKVTVHRATCGRPLNSSVEELDNDASFRNIHIFNLNNVLSINVLSINVLTRDLAAPACG
jgi:hypothetical protein